MSEENNELPEGWVWSTIGAVAETTSGGTPSRNHPEYYSGTIPWVKSGELKDSTITSIEEFITEEGLKNSSAKVFQQGTALVAMYGATVGKTGILGIDATTNQAVCAIFPVKTAFTSKFLIYWLQSQRQALIDQSVGGAQPNINQEIIRALPLPLAPIAEQQRIVAAIEQQFTRLDSGVAALRRAQAKLKRYRAAVLKAAVEGKLTEDWRAEHPSTESASLLLERILKERRAKWEADLRAKGRDPAKVKYVEPAKPDTESLQELPEGWYWATFEQISERVTVGHVGLMRDEYIDNGIPFLRSQNVRPNYFDPIGLKFISYEFHRRLAKSALEPGDILVVRSGSVGVACVMPNKYKEANCSDLVIVKRPITVNPYYAAYYMNSTAQDRVRTKQVGIALTHFNTKSMAVMPLPLAPLAEQEQIVSEVERRLSVIIQLETIVEANLKRAERLRKSILKEAFAGRLVLQDPDDEPASVLLERIRKEREGWKKKGVVGNGRYVGVSGEPGEPVQIDVEGTRQGELWEGVGGG